MTSIDRLLSTAAAIAIALARLGAGLAFAALIGSVLLQAFSRTFLPQSPIWTEELARFALLYLAAFGAGAGIRSGDLVAVDFLTDLAPRRLRLAMLAVGAAATLILAVVIFMPAMNYAWIGRMQTSPALGWRMDWIFVTMPIMAGVLAVFALLRFVELLFGRDTLRRDD